MEHVLEILDHQPQHWPKWQRGRDADDLPTPEQHMFLFERAGYDGSLGHVRAACQYIDGCPWVGPAPAVWSPPQTVLLCLDCMEVSLQHGIQRTLSDS